MRRLTLAAALLTLATGAFASFNIIQVNGPTAPISCDIRTGIAVGAAGPCASPTAACNGSDDSAAFLSFNTWAKARNPARVQLNITSGNCVTGVGWVNGIKSLVVVGYGATISNSIGGYTLAGVGQIQNYSHSTRLNTVAAGALSVTVNPTSSSQPVACNSNATCAALFTVGNYALITGLSIQSAWNNPNGFPSNQHYFEYVKIAAINSSTGQITFDAPLKYGYKSTWPNYNQGSASEIDPGGPATLYALDPSWDMEVEFRGVTINSTAYYVLTAGRSITFRDVAFPGGYGPIPSQNLLWQCINCDCSTCTVMEVDKLVTQMTISGGTNRQISIQSSSIDNLTMVNNPIVTIGLQGTPKTFIGYGLITPLLKLGAYNYGRSDEAVCIGCALTSITDGGTRDLGTDDLGINNTYTISSSGVITVPNSRGTNPSTTGSVNWAVPGTNVYIGGQFVNEVGFNVIDQTQDATNTYIQTSLTGSNAWPGVPQTGGKLAITAHPSPRFTCTNCTGGQDAVVLSLAPARAPLHSYYQITYTGGQSNGLQPQFAIWGNLTSISLNVTSAYTGAGALSFHLSGADNWPVIKSDYSEVAWGTTGPLVNAKITGNRVVTLLAPPAATGAQSLDNLPAVPDTTKTWFTGTSASGPQYSADVSGTCPVAAAGCPTVTVTMQTDQGIVYP